MIFPPFTDQSTIWLTREVLGLEPELYRRYLLERCYRTGCTPLVDAQSLEQAQELAAQTPGAITIAQSGAVPSGLQALAVQE